MGEHAKHPCAPASLLPDERSSRGRPSRKQEGRGKNDDLVLQQCALSR